MTKFLGIEFAPLAIPLERRIQTFAVLQWTLSFLFLGFGSLFLVLYTLIFTKYWYLVLVYGIYYYYDRGTSARGGRRVQWIRRWKIWEYMRDFFPAKLIKTADLDPNKNYIMGFHPHGIMSTGAFLHFGTEATGWSEKFPGIRPYLLVLAGHFQFPVYRDYFMTSGAAEVTSASMRYLLTQNGTGNALGLVVGGALEALEAFPGRFNLKLKNKKGFIKMALKTGASLIPIFSFGETDIFDQMDNPPGSLLRKLQDFLTKYLGFSPPVFHGRGVFNYTFGILPYRKPINTVVGKPIDVEKMSNPTQEDIDKLHQKYLDCLKELFEEHKTQYGVDKDKHLCFID